MYFGVIILFLTPFVYGGNWELTCDCGSTNSKNLESNVSNIVKGTEASLGEFPFAVFLKNKGAGFDEYYVGAGAILNSQYILTTASFIHMVSSIGGEKNIKIVYGVTYIKDYIVGSVDGSRVLQPSEIIIHPDFNYNLENNLAILKVNKQILFEKNVVEPICIPHHDQILDSNEVVAVGWGINTTADFDTYTKRDPSPLRRRTLTLNPNLAECESKWTELFGSKIKFTPNQHLCTYSKKDMDETRSLCLGDFGAPLLSWDKSVNRYVLVGLGLKFNNPIANPKQKYGCIGLNMFVDVRGHVDWIKKVVGVYGNKVCQKKYVP